MLDLFEKIEVKQTERLSGEDLNKIKELQCEFEETINRFNILIQTVDSFNGVAIGNFTASELISDFRDRLKEDTKKFIGDIYYYFRYKYQVSLDYKLWDENKFRWNCYNNGTTWEKSFEYVKSINYNVILDDIYKQLGTLDFINKGKQEFLEEVRKKLGYKITQKNNKISYSSIVSSDSWNTNRINWGWPTDNLNMLFKCINFFENDNYSLSSWADNFVTKCRTDEKDFICFSKHTNLPFAEIEAIQIYKNGKVDLTFSDYETALKYYDMFWRE